MHHASRAALFSTAAAAFMALLVCRAPSAPAEVSTSSASLGDDLELPAPSFIGEMRSGVALLSSWATERPELTGPKLGKYLQRRLRDTSVELTAAYVPYLLAPAPTDAEVADLTPLRASPVPGVESSGYGWRDDPFHGRRKFHAGNDYRADRGTPVYAVGAGTVTFAGRHSGYGNSILIDHGGALITRYAHLKKIEIEEGATVTGAERIGQVGATGRATGPHLHFEVRLAGRPVNPSLAMRVGELQRTAPELARTLAYGLSPAASAQFRDAHDRTNQRMARDGRPERSGRSPRDRNLW
jgi:murein DD-endopeptidase MepM/ murein hydrolase activator NlpD